MLNANYFINKNIQKNSPMSDGEIWAGEIVSFKASDKLRNMFAGISYYEGRQDVLYRQRTAIGENGRVINLENLPNNKLVDNQYRKAVIQKCNYFLGKPFIFQTDNEKYENLLSRIFNRRFHRMMKNIATDALNCGIGWLYLYYDEEGKLSFKKFSPTEIIPIWKDEEHTVLEAAIRIYDIPLFEGREKKIITKAEVYSPSGVRFFIYENGKLFPEDISYQPYFYKEGISYNWERIPLIPFKCNHEELPLINNVKSLQDALNNVISDFANSMQEDARNTILVIKNYDGENLSEFRHNLAAYGAVKVRTVDGADGGVSTLQMNVDGNNYKDLINILRRAIVENAMGFEAKNERMSGNMNQMNIQSMYSDIDLDTNETETEFQGGIEELLDFLNWHFSNIGMGDFSSQKVDVIFDRDMMMNESEIIDDVIKSNEILSKKTILANHPFVKDVSREIKLISEESLGTVRK